MSPRARRVAKTDYQSVDDYLAAQPAPVRSVLARVRQMIRKALPRATERVSYQIPVFEIDGTMILYIAGYPRHYAIYPATPGVIEALGQELAGKVHGKATIRFPIEEPVPARLIARIAKLRAAEAAERAAARAAKKKTAKKKTSSSRSSITPARSR